MKNTVARKIERQISYTMKNKPLGFAIIGTGSIAGVHAGVLSAMDGVRLVGVFNRTHKRAISFAGQFQCKAYADLSDLLAEESLDAVCICSASGAHLEHALACIEAGKHCLIEKPLEVTPERCIRLLEAADRRGVKIGTVFHSRFYEASQLLRRAVAAGRFGQPVLGSAYVKWSRDVAYYTSADWRGTWAYDGGGVLMNQGIHAVDLLQWYMGPVSAVQAKVANRRHTAIEVEDTIVVNVIFESGALGSIECTTAAFPGSSKRIEVVGTSGTAVLEEDRLTAWQFAEEAAEDEAIRQAFSAMRTPGGADNPMNITHTGHQLQIADFADAIRTDRSPLIDGREGSKSVAIIHAIYESARTGETVYLEKNDT